jgi:hypothetical protein
MLFALEATESASVPGAAGEMLVQQSDAASVARREVVFLDTSVAGWQVLRDGVRDGAEVVLIGKDQNGIEVIADTLAGRSGLDAIHVLSHGSAGQLQLGTATLSQDTLEDYADQLATMKSALAPGGDILLYGCRVADSGSGVQFVKALAEAADADVAASDDLTGSTASGGDWRLEHRVGEVESLLPIGQYALDTFTGTLFTGPVTLDFNSPDGTGYGTIVTDGEGGTSDITGITLQFFIGDDNGFATGENIHYFTRDGYEGLGSNDPTFTGYQTLVIEEQFGGEFDFNGFTAADWGATGGTLTIEGFRNNISTGTPTTLNLVGNSTQIYSNIEFSDAQFGNVDRIIIKGDWGDGKTYATFDKFQFSTPVTPAIAPTLNATGNTRVFTEDGGATASLFTTADARVEDAGQIFTGMTLTVTNVGANDSLKIDGTTVSLTNSAPTALSDGGSYAVSVAEGTATVSLTNLARTDAAMNTLIQSISYNSTDQNPFTADRVISITGITDSGSSNNTASPDIASRVSINPVADVASVAISNGANATGTTHKVGDTIDVTLKYDQAVSVTGTPVMKLDIGGVERLATYQSGTDSTALVFRYTVQAGDSDSDGMAVRANGIDLGGGTIRDRDGVQDDADLTFPVASNANAKVDGVAPRVTSIARQDPTGGITNADSLKFRVTFDSEVSNVDPNDFTMAGAAGAVIGVAPVGGSAYDVTVSGGDLTGLTGVVTLGFADGQDIMDAAGNALVDTTPVGTSDNSYTIDNTTPTLSDIDLVDASDSGWASSDALTNDTTPTISFTAETGAVIEIDWGDGNGYVAVGAGTGAEQQKVLPTSYVTDGTRLISVRATDAAGNATTKSLNITIDTAVPVLDGTNSSPADGNTSIPVGTNPVIDFSEAVAFGATGTIELHNITTGTAVQIWTLSDAGDIGNGDGQISITGNKLTINPTGTLKAGTDYSVHFSAGSLVDAAGNGLAAITDNTTYNFTTIIPTVTLSADSSMAETGGSATVTATLSAATSTDTTVTVAASGTATQGTDYNLSSTTITIQAGQTTGTAFLTPTGDTLDESDETVVLDIATISGAASENGTQQVTITLLDDDAESTVDLSFSSDSLSESGGTAIITATLSTASSKIVTIPLTLTGTAAGNGTDYTITTTVITINPGDVTSSVTVTGVDDALIEGSETITATLGTLTHATPGTATAVTLTVADDDVPSVTLTRLSPATTGAGSVEFLATLSAAPDAPSTVDATDFAILPGAGVTAGMVTVTDHDDNDPRTFRVRVSDVAGNGTLGLNFVDDDSIKVSTVGIGGNGTGNGNATGPVLTIDSTAPTIAIDTIAADDRINATEDDGAVTVSGTTDGVEDGQSATVQFGTLTRTAPVSGNAWSVTVTADEIQGEPPGNLTVTADVSDLAGNAAAQATRTVVYDRTAASAPILALLTDTGASNSDGITRTGTVSVSNLEAGARWEYSTDVGGSWMPGSAAGFTLDAGTYGSGQVQARQTDDAGNVSAAGLLAATVTVDTTAPAPTLALGSDTGGSPSDGITQIGSVTLAGLEAGASWEYSTDTGSSWAPGTGSSFTLAAGSYASGQVQVRQTDLAGNPSAAGLSGAVTVDATPPTVHATVPMAATDMDRNGTYGAGDELTITFAEPVQESLVTLADLTMGGHLPGTGASLTAVSPSDGYASIFTLRLGAGTTVEADDTVTLPADKVVDRAGNQAARALDFTVPQLGPYVTSIAPNAAGKGAATVDYTVVFSVAVTNVDVADFILTSTGSAAGRITGISGSGNTYTVTVGTNADTQGTLRLDLIGSGTGIKDAGDRDVVSGFTSGIVHDVDRIAPAVIGVSIPDAAMKIGDAVTATILVDADTDSYTLTSGTIGGFALGDLTRIDATTYTARFTVVAGGADVAAGSAIPVSLVLKDASGNENLPYTTPIAQAADAIDANLPAVTSATVNGSTLTLTFSEPVEMTDPTGMSVTVGAASRTVTGVTGTGTNTLVLTLGTPVSSGQAVLFGYDPTAGSGDLQDKAGQEMAALVNHAVANTTPAPPPVSPPSVPAPTTVDGVQIGTGTVSNGDGTTSQVITIPVVMPTRPEEIGNNTVADIPLVKAPDGRSLLETQVPTGVGLTVTGSAMPKAAGASLTDLIREIKAHTEAGTADQAQLTGGGSGFLADLPSNAPLLVRTIVPTGAPDSNTAPAEALVIRGQEAAAGEPMTALVIDTRGLPLGTVIQLHHVEFAAVIGAATITGGDGSQNVWGDGAAQYIVLGADDDILHGGAGDDTVGSAGGDDQIFGGAGNDIVFGGAGNDTIDGGAGNDTLILAGASRGDYTLHIENGRTIFTHRGGGADGTDSVADVEVIRFTGARDLTPDATLTRLYEVLFDRAPDRTEKDTWLEANATGMSMNDIADGLLESAEAQHLHSLVSDAQYIDQLYTLVLNRAGDAPGRAYWTDQLSSGLTDRADVLLSFVNSVENLASEPAVAAELNFDQSDAATLVRLYSALFDRHPDQAGINYWLAASEGGSSLPDIADGFINSLEAQSHYTTLDNEAFVDKLYRTALGREGESAGRAAWMGALNSGDQDRGDVLLGFANSAEKMALIGVINTSIETL